MLPFIRLILAAVFLAGCTASENIDGVEKEVARFHALLDEERFEAIWHQGTTEFQKAVTREEFVEFLSAVHRKLGTVQSAKRQGWNVNYTTAGTLVTLSYATAFREGEAAEQFTYRNDGQVSQLLRYDISSKALILK